MTIAPDELCHRLGETRCKEMFFALNAVQMKAVLGEAKIPAVRQPHHTSTKKRNDDWANRLWRAMPTGNEKVGSTLLYQWLSTARNQMMGAFLDLLGVAHKNGLTEADFWPSVEEDKTVEAARQLIADTRFDHGEVAAYLLFLDYQNKTSRLASLDLLQHLPALPK